MKVAKKGLRLLRPMDHLPHFVFPIPFIGNPKLPHIKNVRQNFPISKVSFSLLTLAPNSTGFLPGAKRGQGGRRRNGVFARSYLSRPDFHPYDIFVWRHLGTWENAGIFIQIADKEIGAGTKRRRKETKYFLKTRHRGGGDKTNSISTRKIGLGGKRRGREKVHNKILGEKPGSHSKEQDPERGGP